MATRFIFLILGFIGFAAFGQQGEDRSVASRRAATIASQLASMPNTYTPGSSQWMAVEMQKQAAQQTSAQDQNAGYQTRSQAQFTMPTIQAPKIETVLPPATQPRDVDALGSSGDSSGASQDGDIGSLIQQQQQQIVATERATAAAQKAATDTMEAQVASESAAQIAKIQLQAVQRIASMNAVSGANSVGISVRKKEKNSGGVEVNSRLKSQLKSDPLAYAMDAKTKPSDISSTGRAPASTYGDFSVPGMKGHGNTLGPNASSSLSSAENQGAPAQVINLRQ